jgi:hypothetical protein
VQTLIREYELERIKHACVPHEILDGMDDGGGGESAETLRKAIAATGSRNVWVERGRAESVRGRMMRLAGS